MSNETRTYVSILMDGTEDRFPAVIIKQSVVIEVTECTDDTQRSLGCYRIVLHNGAVPVLEKID